MSTCCVPHGHTAFLKSSNNPMRGSRVETAREEASCPRPPPSGAALQRPLLQGPEEEAVCGTVGTGRQEDQDGEWPLHQQLLQAGPVSKGGGARAGLPRFYRVSPRGAACSWATGVKSVTMPHAASLTRLPSYQKWKQKQKIDDRDSEEEGASNLQRPARRGGRWGQGQGRVVLKTGWQVVHWSPGDLALWPDLGPSVPATYPWGLPPPHRAGHCPLAVCPLVPTAPS